MRASALLLALPIWGGCCVAVPKPDKYFDRTWDALDAARMFQYAVHTKQYSYAYDCLTPNSQAEYPRSRFALFLRLGHIEELRDVPAWDIIVGMKIVDGHFADPEQTEYVVVTEYVDEDRGFSIEIPCYFIDVEPGEAEEWRLDFERTATAFVMGE